MNNLLLIFVILILSGCISTVQDYQSPDGVKGKSQLHMEAKTSLVTFRHSKYVGYFSQIEAENGDKLIPNTLSMSFSPPQSINLSPGQYKVTSKCSSDGGTAPGRTIYVWIVKTIVTISDDESLTLGCRLTGKKTKNGKREMELFELGRTRYGEKPLIRKKDQTDKSVKTPDE